MLPRRMREPSPLIHDRFLELDRLVVRPRPAGSISVTVGRGERLVILGEARTGKTALLRALAGFLAPDAGDIRLGGRSILPEKPERRGVALIPARDTLFPHRSLRDNLLFALRARGLPAAFSRARAVALLAAHGLAAVSGSRPARLSAPQRRRAEFCRALAAAPLLVLIDSAPGEPPAPTLLADADVTVVLATGDAAAALGIATRILLLDTQGPVQFGTPYDLYERPSNAYVARFMGPCNLVASPHGLLAIRPHRMRLDPAGTLRGEVSAVAYQGAVTRVLVATPQGEMTADLASPPDGAATGQTVGLAWDDATAWALPGE